MSNILEETNFILKKYNIRANKSLGQNFLINQDVIDEIVKSADIDENDLVIEIGPELIPLMWMKKTRISAILFLI